MRLARRMLMVTLIAAPLAVQSTGCSWLFQKSAPGPPVWDHAVYANCDSSYAWPVVDALLAVLYGATAVALIEGSLETGQPTAQGVMGSVFWVGIHAASSVSGISSASTCTEFGEHIARMAERRERERPRRVETTPVAPDPSGPSSCGRDTDCKGDRICVRGDCVDPLPREPEPTAAPLP